MHYCFFSTGSWQGNGTLLRLRELGSAMIRQGVRVSYLADRCPYNQSSLDLHPEARLVLVDSQSFLGKARERRERLRALKPDFLHVLAAGAAAWTTLSPFREVPIVGDWDEWPARRPYLGWRHKMIARIVDHWLRNHSALHVVASRYMQREFDSQYQIHALYLPHASYMPDFPEGQSPFTQPTAVYMGNFYPAYDHDILFEAARLLKARGRTPQIELIAGGPDLEHWRNWVKRENLGNILLPGYLEGAELWRHLRHAHVLLFPLRDLEVNRYRCPGKTFFYAQAKRPTIATRVGEVYEVLKDKGIYAECTPQGFADAIDRCMQTAVLPDVDYGLDGWDARARTLLDALSASPVKASEVASVRA